MTREELINICKYYKGEKECPYEDFGKHFWWVVEMYGVDAKDEIKSNTLSKTMLHYILEHHWDGDCQHNTDKETAIKRATELYNKGLWSGSYICSATYTINDVEQEYRRLGYNISSNSQ